MSDELRRTLSEAGGADAPEPDPAFVAELGARLRGGATVAPRRQRRPILPAAAAVLVIAGAVGLAIGLATDHDVDRVTTEPSPSTTTSTTSTTTTSVPAVTSTTVAGPTTTTATSLPVVPTTTTQPRSTTTTTAPRPTTTTTTAPAGPEDLRLTCTTDPSGPSISCRWAASTRPAFASFRLTRRTHDGPESTLYEGTATSFSGSSLNGARWVYTVTSRDAAGTVLGSSTVDVNCC